MIGLNNFQLKRNRIGKNGLSDVLGLLECPSIAVLDISENYIDDPEILP
jgi:dynein assembly factor 1